MPSWVYCVPTSGWSREMRWLRFAFYHARRCNRMCFDVVHKLYFSQPPYVLGLTGWFSATSYHLLFHFEKHAHSFIIVMDMGLKNAGRDSFI